MSHEKGFESKAKIRFMWGCDWRWSSETGGRAIRRLARQNTGRIAKQIEMFFNCQRPGIYPVSPGGVIQIVRRVSCGTDPVAELKLCETEELQQHYDQNQDITPA